MDRDGQVLKTQIGIQEATLEDGLFIWFLYMGVS